jgi:hypothetical protein
VLDADGGDVGLGRDDEEAGRGGDVVGLLVRSDDADESEAFNDCRLLVGVLMPVVDVGRIASEWVVMVVVADDGSWVIFVLELVVGSWWWVGGRWWDLKTAFRAH